MIKEEYKNGCRLKEQVKYNIDYDDCQILNLTCANYIYDLVQESSKYETKLEDIKKMLYMIEKLLGHEVQYDIPEYHGDNKKCYFGVVSDNFVINEDNIKQLDYVLQDTKEFVKSFSTDYQKILYCYPNEFGDINSIKDQNQYSNVVSFLFTEDSKSKRGFYLSTNKDSEINKENPLIVTLFFTPLYHLTQILDGDKNWEINNSGYTKDVISINNYPFSYLENSNIVNNYRETLDKNIGNTSNRPIGASKGFQYFDTTINKPIFWDGSKWIDATGATV